MIHHATNNEEDNNICSFNFSTINEHENEDQNDSNQEDEDDNDEGIINGRIELYE
jgi:hypothetical protein